MAAQAHRQLKIKNTSYIWQGLDARGNPARGEIVGSSLTLVKAQLRKQGLRPTKVRKKPRPLFQSRAKIKAMDIAVFTRQLATMTRAGIPLVQAFEIVGQGLENAAMRGLVFAVRDQVASGTAFTEAIRQHPRHFDELYANLVEAGEQSGALDTMLERLASYKEKSEALKARLRKALSYPIAVIGVALVVTGVLLVKVVPQFAETFSSFGAELPLFTQYVMQLSDFAIDWWMGILLAGGAGALLFRETRRRSRTFREGLEALSLKLPIFGTIVKKSALARFCRTLSTTFAAGLPLVDALDSVAGATGNAVYRQATLQVREQLTGGQQLSQAVRATRRFPLMMIQMLAVGEEAGALDTMLDKCASFYEAEVDNAVDGLTALMEPLIMAILGILVGGLMIAMYLPIFQIGAVI